MSAPGVGDRFGRYRLDRLVGMGGMGVVYEATDTRLQRPVAVKVISARYASDEGFRRRFEREADTLARLDSPHVITIYDAGEVDGHPYIATQYVAGGDLGQALEDRGPLPVSGAIEVARQLAEALHDAHSAGVVHRDIKPSNVLLRNVDAARLHAYLCDFGIAHDEGGESLTSADGVVGTWAYLAPERLDGASAGQSSDIYSLGCLLWACLTGAAPYRGSDYAVARSHQHAPVRQLTTAGPRPDGRVLGLNRILARTLAKHPADRYPSAAALAADLAALPVTGAPPRPLPIPGDPPPAGAQPAAPTAAATAAGGYVVGGGPPTGTPTTGKPPSRTGRWALAVAAVLVACLVAGLAIWRPWADDDPTAETDPTPPTDQTELTSPTSSGPTSSGPATPDLPVGSYMAELADRGTVRIGVRFDTPGLGYREPGGDEPTGFDIEIAKILAGGLGIGSDSIEWIETVPVDRESALEAGTVDLVLASYAITDERREVVGQAGPYLVTGLQFLVPDGSAIDGAGDLRGGQRVCAVEGSTTAEVVSENGMEVVPGQTVTECIDSVRAGDADAAAGDGAILLGYAARYPGDFELVGRPPLTEERLGVGYSLDHPEMCDWINQTLADADADADGDFDTAFEDTLGADGEPDPPLPPLDSCPS